MDIYPELNSLFLWSSEIKIADQSFLDIVEYHQNKFKKELGFNESTKYGLNNPERLKIEFLNMGDCFYISGSCRHCYGCNVRGEDYIDLKQFSSLDIKQRSKNNGYTPLFLKKFIQKERK